MNHRFFSSLLRPPPALIFLIFAGWALLLTFPLALHLFSHIPLGTEQAATVPLFNLWSLQWNIDQLLQGYPHYWDAPMFAPLRGAFAFSETQPLTAVLAAPFWLGWRSPALGYNLVLLLFLTLNGWFTFWLVREWLGQKTGPGTTTVPLLAGLLMQSLPFVAQEMGVLQLTAIFGFLWALLFVSRFLREAGRGQPRQSTLLALALGLPVTFLTCGYYGLFSLVFLPAAFLFQLKAAHLRPRFMGWLLAAAVVSAVVTLPWLSAQRRILHAHGFSRSAETIAQNSARWEEYLQVAAGSFFYHRLLDLQAGPGQRLFPGLGLLLLAGLGLWGRGLWRIKGYLLLAIFVAFLLSLGLRPENWLPYRWLYDNMPGFSALRSPFRFAGFVQIHLVLLAGLGLFNLQRRFARPWVVVAAGTLAIVELLSLPLPLQPLPGRQTAAPWQTWLNQHPHPATVVMLPFAASPHVADFEQTVIWLLESRYFQGRMLNGYSGFFPNHHAQLRQQVLTFPSPGSLEFLERLGARYAVVHHALPGAPAQRYLDRYLPRVFYDDRHEVSIYELAGGE